ncbi:cadmium, cobalt and zinc/H(+)-K(+) antiporter [Paraliobacillus ryukyuensis]|uniref:Cobalt-zinc-cadmium efflux system protein n=1 Tax=Paraliobacillus ryukyuensis TaxID=200904 RepID=A0A366E7D4_9BACI|nr:cation diffusion facilitator family transporter [Paraliobacillus ryukyuensis]RBO98300.1 cobalt-zinc-cadmium efflux system protein [Paraliobacillus ryukyuensis]
MAHNHTHDHSHSHNHNANKKALLISFCLIAGFMVVEVIGGIITNSLALLSDAGHMLSDAASLGLSFFAFKYGEKAATSSKTFGYKRFEILAAFINGLALMVISIYIFWEAFHRFFEPPSVSGSMMIIAIIGLIVNILVAWILMRGDTNENLNLRSALLHVMGDLLGSVGAIIAGILILVFDWNIADPIASVIVAILILVSGWRITRDSIHVLMEGIPSNIDLKAVEDQLLRIDGVHEVHDLHVWSITSDFPALSCHLIVQSEVNRDTLLQEASSVLHNQFDLDHTTIQMEGEGTSIIDHEHSCN